MLDYLLYTRNFMCRRRQMTTTDRVGPSDHSSDKGQGEPSDDALRENLDDLIRHARETSPRAAAVFEAVKELLDRKKAK